MAKRRAFQEKKEKSKTSEQSGVTKKKLNKKWRNFSTNSTEEAGSFFVKSFDETSANEKEFASPSKSSKHSFNEEKQHQVQASKVGKSGDIKHEQIKEENSVNEKKPFDKKLFRLKKYSKKYKLQQWEDQRKKTLLREYHRSLKGVNEPKWNVAKIYEEDDLESEQIKADTVRNDNTVNDEEKPKQRKPFLKPHERFQKIKEEKQKKKEEMLQRQAEREKAIKQANKERYERNKKLSQKTKKGQPIMRYRMEMLLEKIEKSIKS